MLHIASHAPGFLMQLLARLPESIADSKFQIGMAFVLWRSALDIHLLALGQREEPAACLVESAGGHFGPGAIEPLGEPPRRERAP